MKLKLLLIPVIMLFAGCSDKDDDGVIDGGPSTNLYVAVCDEEGNDLLDISSPECILNPDLIVYSSNVLDNDTKYKYSGVCDYDRCYDPHQAFECYGEIVQLDGRYTIRCIYFPSTQLPSENVSIVLSWKEGIEPDNLSFRLHTPGGDKNVSVTINGEPAERIYKEHVEVRNFRYVITKQPVTKL